MTTASLLSRRRLARLAALCLPASALPEVRPAGARPPGSGPFVKTPGVLVAGPDGGALARWAAALAPPLGRALPSSAMRETTVGGVDGVTGANQFDTRAAPDGTTALLAPGAAALAWLVGDPRAQFDVARWVPVLAGQTPCVLAARGPLDPARPLRLGALGPAGPDLPGLLALDLLDVQADAVFGLGEQAAADAFAAGQTDAVLLRGAGVPGRLASLPGARAMFTFGAVDEAGQIGRDPLLPDVPHLGELGGARPGPLRAAWEAAAAASQLAFGLVLPRLTPPELVAVWRRAAGAAAQAPEMQAMAAASATRPLTPQAATSGISRIAADADSLLELRRWLAQRYGWHPA